MKPWLVPLLACALVACSRGKAAPAPEPTSASSAAALPNGAPAFREDDFDAALAEAKAKHLPLFVDAWAPWCHTCASLRAFVLNDAALAPITPRFVWLSLDTEKPSSRGFLAKYPMEAWPTLWVIDPESDAAVLKWPGSLTARELVALLDDVADAVETKAPPSEADAALARADALAASGNAKEAAAAYRHALAKAPAKWPRRARAIDSLVTELASAKDVEACAETAEKALPTLPPGTSLANVAINGLECASDGKRATADRIAAVVEKLATDPALPILADDRSGLFEVLVRYRREKNAVGASNAARAWADFLEGEAKKAPTPAARAVFDAHRLLAYEALGDVTKALPMLEESERDLPDDYNPPARLARAFFDMKRWDASIAASNDALRKVYGPRKLRVLAQKAEAQRAKGDRDGERATLAEAVKAAHEMELSPAQKKLAGDLEEKLRALGP